MAALAFEHFARRRVDIAIIETGLGGRLDATNVLRPEVSVITDIDYDHAEILGPTLADIAGEKAGIIKTGIPVVTGRLSSEAARVIRATCRGRCSPMIPLRKTEYSIRPDHRSLDFGWNGLQLQNVKPALLGRHQLWNCALVLKVLGVLREGGFEIGPKAIRQGLAETSWPGRFQVIPGGKQGATVILDVGHNPGGAAAFAETFKQVFPGRKARFLLGLVKRKQHQEIINLLSGVAELFWLVPMQTKRTTDVRELEATLDWGNVPHGRSAKLETGLRKLLKDSSPDDIIAVVGSHYLVGEYLSRYPS